MCISTIDYYQSLHLKVSLRHAEKTFQQVVTGKPCEVGHDNNVEQKIRPTVVHCDSSTSNTYAIIVLKL